MMKGNNLTVTAGSNTHYANFSLAGMTRATQELRFTCLVNSKTENLELKSAKGNCWILKQLGETIMTLKQSGVSYSQAVENAKGDKSVEKAIV